MHEEDFFRPVMHIRGQSVPCVGQRPSKAHGTGVSCVGFPPRSVRGALTRGGTRSTRRLTANQRRMEPTRVPLLVVVLPLLPLNHGVFPPRGPGVGIRREG